MPPAQRGRPERAKPIIDRLPAARASTVRPTPPPRDRSSPTRAPVEQKARSVVERPRTLPAPQPAVRARGLRSARPPRPGRPAQAVAVARGRRPSPKAPLPPARQVAKPAATRAPGAARTRASAVSASTLPWLSIRAGALVDSRGQPLRLIGLRSEGDGAPCDLQALMADVPAGQRCVSLPLRVVAQLTPAALARLDETIAALAEAGAYSLLRVDARLWLHGHHLKLARRYAGHSAVMFALLGRERLADKLLRALLALRAWHPAACVWLPLESARSACASLPDPRVGLLWDAVRPQAPRAPGLAGGLRAPLLLDGWQPNPRHPLADDRLMRLCQQGGIGWLARCDAAAMSPGPERTRSARLLPDRWQLAWQRALFHSLQPPTGDGPPAA